jgi:hypothetical protein
MQRLAKGTWRGLRVFVPTACLLPLFLSAGNMSPEVVPVAAKNRYIGAAKCKNCHGAAESGDQFGAWQKEKHPNAYRELASEKATEYGKARGIAEPQKSEQCLKCHVTAFGVAKEELHKSFDPTLGVQCESCHGPGENHLKARMAAAAEAPEGEAPKYAAIPSEEIIANPTMQTCLGCHNEESPSFKPFCFHKFREDIRHLNPLKPRTEAERAAILVCGCGTTCACKNGCEDGKCGVSPKERDAKQTEVKKEAGK